MYSAHVKYSTTNAATDKKNNNQLSKDDFFSMQ